MSHGPKIVQFHVCLPDSDEWFSFQPKRRFGTEAVELAKKHADAPAGQALLTRSLVAISKDAMDHGAGGGGPSTIVWVPDRQTGEVVFFGYRGIYQFRSTAEANADAYATMNMQKYIGPKFKVLDHSVIRFDCPTGPGVMHATVQRERFTASTVWVAESMVFPTVPGLTQAPRCILFTTHLDLGVELTEASSGMAKSFRVDIQP